MKENVRMKQNKEIERERGTNFNLFRRKESVIVVISTHFHCNEKPISDMHSFGLCKNCEKTIAAQ